MAISSPALLGDLGPTSTASEDDGDRHLALFLAATRLELGAELGSHEGVTGAASLCNAGILDAAFVGPSRSGKSTLVNVLLGRICCPMGAMADSLFPVAFSAVPCCSEGDERIELRLPAALSVKLAALAEETKEGAMPGDRGELAAVLTEAQNPVVANPWDLGRRLQVLHSAGRAVAEELLAAGAEACAEPVEVVRHVHGALGPLRRWRLVDYPGTSERADSAAGQLVAAVLERGLESARTAMVFCVVAKDQLGTETATRALAPVLVHKRCRRIWLINKVDSEGERMELERRASAEIRQLTLGDPVLFVSGRQLLAFHLVEALRTEMASPEHLLPEFGSPVYRARIQMVEAIVQALVPTASCDDRSWRKQFREARKCSLSRLCRATQFPQPLRRGGEPASSEDEDDDGKDSHRIGSDNSKFRVTVWKELARAKALLVLQYLRLPVRMSASSSRARLTDAASADGAADPEKLKASVANCCRARSQLRQCIASLDQDKGLLSKTLSETCEQHLTATLEDVRRSVVAKVGDGQHQRQELIAKATSGSANSEAGSHEEPTASTSSADAGSVQAGDARVGGANSGVAEAGSAQAGSAEAGSAEASSAEAGSADACGVQTGSTEAGSSQAGSSQADKAQACSASHDAEADVPNLSARMHAALEELEKKLARIQHEWVVRDDVSLSRLCGALSLVEPVEVVAGVERQAGTMRSVESAIFRLFSGMGTDPRGEMDWFEKTCRMYIDGLLSATPGAVERFTADVQKRMLRALERLDTELARCQWDLTKLGLWAASAQRLQTLFASLLWMLKGVQVEPQEDDLAQLTDEQQEALRGEDVEPRSVISGSSPQPGTNSPASASLPTAPPGVAELALVHPEWTWWAASKPTLATSLFMTVFVPERAPASLDELADAVREVAFAHAVLEGVPQKAATEFAAKLIAESRPDSVEPRDLAAKLWIAQAPTLRGRPFSFLVNAALRGDAPPSLLPAAQVSMALFPPPSPTPASPLSSGRPAPPPDPPAPDWWPEAGLVYRGGSLPEEHQGFFTEGRQFCSPAALALFFGEADALAFAARRAAPASGRPACLWTIRLGPGAPVVALDVQGGLRELLLAPYAAYRIEHVTWQEAPSAEEPHRVELLACSRGGAGPGSEWWPLAPWS